MGGYRRHRLATYLVGWDESLMIKAGVTNAQRWRKFCMRGARIEMLHVADPGNRDYCRLEVQLDQHLKTALRPAFANKRESDAYLGTGGAGWMECYRADAPDAYLDALAACRRIMLTHPLGQCSESIPTLMHGRTDARTYVDPHLNLRS